MSDTFAIWQSNMAIEKIHSRVYSMGYVHSHGLPEGVWEPHGTLETDGTTPIKEPQCMNRSHAIPGLCLDTENDRGQFPRYLIWVKSSATISI